MPNIDLKPIWKGCKHLYPSQAEKERRPRMTHAFQPDVLLVGLLTSSRLNFVSRHGIYSVNTAFLTQQWCGKEIYDMDNDIDTNPDIKKIPTTHKLNYHVYVSNKRDTDYY